VAFLTLLQSQFRLQQTFLEKELPPGRKPADTGIFLFVLSGNADLRYPRDLKVRKELIALLEKVSLSGRPLQSAVRWKDRDYLIVGQPGKHLRQVFLFALIPQGDLEDAVNRLKRGILLCLGAGLLVALFSGLLLSGHFLRPIAELHRGMLALQRRDVDFRVPVSSLDEFGELAQSFNLMIEDLREMELAKIVQKSLIPDILPEIPGYQVFLKNLVATDLGGDYCDVLPMPDHRFLLVIGDVTGHGVGAALGMAMAKAVTFQFAREGGEPDVLLQRLNGIFFQALHRKKMMTFFALVLFPASGQIRFSNAGHPYPLLRFADGRLEELAQVNVPLGARTKRQTFSTLEQGLAPGDTVLFLTDGLLEGSNPAKGQFGYDMVQAILREESAKYPERLVSSLLRAFRTHRESEELEDDLTLMILRRKDPA